MVISVSDLSKHYQVHKKQDGLKGFITSLIARKYETIEAVSGVSFEIKEGELVGFIGPNGAGKTTTLKCLTGLLYPTKGKISVLGFNPQKRQNEFLKQIALVMGQKNQLWWDLPAMDTFTLNKEIYEINDSEFKESIKELSSILEVENLMSTPVKKLSLGERMKMELIAALIHKPKVLFLDEPTIGLDVLMQKKMREFIRAYNQRYKATVILTSHYMGDVEALCKRVIVINHGKILFDGQLKNIIKKFAPYKVISMVLADYVDPLKFEQFGMVKKFNYPQLTIRVPKEKSYTIASQIYKKMPVEDLNIEDPQIEDVIGEIFSKGKI